MKHDASWFDRQLARCDAAISHAERLHTDEEQQRAIERAEQDRNRIIGRREPQQQTLTLAA